MAPAKGGVPETLLKKRKRDEDWAAKRTATSDATKKKAKASRKEIFKRAEAYVKEYRSQVSTHKSNLSVRCSTGAAALLGQSSLLASNSICLVASWGSSMRMGSLVQIRRSPLRSVLSFQTLCEQAQHCRIWGTLRSV